MICIYRYYCKSTGKSYIGQTVDFASRKREHKSSAYNENDKCYNDVIHKAIRMHGLDDFDISILEECSREQLNEREIYWIAYYNSYKDGYNATPGGQPGGYNGKQVDIFDLDGNYIKSYDNAKIAAQEIGVAYSSLQQVLHQLRPTCKGYQIKYHNDNRVITKFISRQGGSKAVLVLNDENDILFSFPSIAAASRELHLDASSIAKVCKGKLIHCGPYRFRYEEE